MAYYTETDWAEGELPEWAGDSLAQANDPYLQGYWARYEGEPYDEGEEQEWKDGWIDCRNEMQAERPTHYTS